MILPYLQANNLAFCCFIDANRRPKTSGSERKAFSTHGKIRSVSFMCAMVPLCLPNFLGLCYRRETEAGESSILEQALSKPVFCLGGRHYFIPQGCSLKTYQVKRGHETSWYLGPGTWDPLLQCLHLDKCLLEQQNTEKL